MPGAARSLPAPAASLWRSSRWLIPKRGLARRAGHFADYITGGLGAVTRAHPGIDVYRNAGILGDRLFDARIPGREVPLSLDSGRNLLTEFLVHDRRGRFAGEYMTKVDGATMHHALEARAPFLDQDLWRFAARLPYSVRLRGGCLKAVLRELAARRIGPQVAAARKRGFGIPVRRWLTHRWRTDFEKAFHGSELAAQGWVNEAAIRGSFSQAVAEGEATNQLWYLYILESWLRRESAVGVTEPASYPTLAAAHNPGQL
jgi:asparagine synthase (glutamine-hydrolysing)